MKKLEAEFIRQCSPTLAGLKMANLFRFRFALGVNPWQQVEEINQQLRSKGLKVEILSYKLCDNSALLYVYRQAKVQQHLQDPAVRSFLFYRGYEQVSDVVSLLHQFALRINLGQDFPHEIGLILGYPLADVIAYIKAPRAKGICTGCWKAYTDPTRAQNFHQKCTKCAQVYWECYSRGFSLQRLAVAV